MKPTTVMTTTPSQTMEVVPLVQQALVPVQTGSVVLRQDQAMEAANKARELNLANMSTASIAKLGFEAERDLHQTLDGFLAHLDEREAAQLFTLFDRLGKGVEDAKLPDLLKKITDGDISFWYRVVGFFSKARAAAIARQSYATAADILQGRTKTLKDVMNQLERDLNGEMNKLVGKLTMLETLKQDYGQHIAAFAVTVATMQIFLESARQEVAQKRDETRLTPSIANQTELQELEDKLQLLESRSLALEGVYTKLPADQVVIRQIEQAGVSTLQETATTAAGRFASIKQTLLALHGALGVKSLQNLGQTSARLDAQLAQMRGALLTDIATRAATAPGDNRLEQARQIRQIISETEAIQKIVAEGRAANVQKFQQARQEFLAARQELTQLSS
jgi:hypothetical protein